MDDQEFQVELTRLLEEEVPKRRQAEVHEEIGVLLHKLELCGHEMARKNHASEVPDLQSEIILQLLEIARSKPEHAREHRGLVSLAEHLGGPAWVEALATSEE